MDRKHCRNPFFLQLIFLAWRHSDYSWRQICWHRHWTVGSVPLNLGITDMSLLDLKHQCKTSRPSKGHASCRHSSSLGIQCPKEPLPSSKWLVGLNPSVVQTFYLGCWWRAHAWKCFSSTLPSGDPGQGSRPRDAFLVDQGWVISAFLSWGHRNSPARFLSLSLPLLHGHAHSHMSAVTRQLPNYSLKDVW